MMSSLPNNIAGQDAALETILNAISVWESNKKYGPSGPLVLAIVGQNGVGKSETGRSKRYVPTGLLVLNGIDYSKEKMEVMGGMGEIQKEITQRMTDHLTDCGGNALIIVDEMQKLANGTLGAFQSGLQEGGSFLALKSVYSFFGPAREVYHSISTENTIFLFITDIGASIIEDLIVSYGDRNKIPQSVIRKTARSALVDHTGDVNFAKLISEVIPYMPMENAQIQELLRTKIRKLEYVLNVDDSAVAYMCGPSFVDYRGVSKSSSDEMVSEYKSFAYYSGRSVTNGLIPDLQKLIKERMHSDEIGKIRHIGFDADFKELILQWCNREILISNYKLLNTDVSKTDDLLRSLKIDDNMSSSIGCRTVWTGKFEKDNE